MTFESFFWTSLLGADSRGASGAEKGLHDLGTYFGMFSTRDEDERQRCLLASGIGSRLARESIEEDRSVRCVRRRNYASHLSAQQFELSAQTTGEVSARVHVERLIHVRSSSPLLVIIQRCQPDLKSKYEDDFQMSLKDYTKWSVIFIRASVSHRQTFFCVATRR